jgi:hypothetical protein
MSRTLAQPIEILEYYNQNAAFKNLYRLHIDDLGRNIITNLPPVFYNEKSFEDYEVPTNISAEDVAFIEQTKTYFDKIQEINGGSLFQLNACFENSVTVFRLLETLDSSPGIKITSPVKLVMGIYEQQYGIFDFENGFKIDHTNVVIHDFHVWNLINNILIDVSVLKMNTAPERPDQDWMKANDHIYIYPKSGCKYIGRAFTDLGAWEVYYKNLMTDNFPVANLTL